MKLCWWRLYVNAGRRRWRSVKDAAMWQLWVFGTLLFGDASWVLFHMQTRTNGDLKTFFTVMVAEVKLVPHSSRLWLLLLNNSSLKSGRLPLKQRHPHILTTVGEIQQMFLPVAFDSLRKWLWALVSDLSPHLKAQRATLKVDMKKDKKKHAKKQKRIHVCVQVW